MTKNRPGPDEVKMTDVARLARVSSATVSRALRDLPGVSDDTRRRVREVADELSYVVSPEASRLSRRETDRIAVVLPRLDTWFFSTVLSSIEHTMHERGVDVLVYQVAEERQRQIFFDRLPSRRKVDTVILVAPPLRAEEEQRLDLLGVHVVVVSGRLRDFPHVEVDDYAMARAATEHLLDLGHTRPALIRTTDTDGAVWSSDVSRQLGYREAVAARHLAARSVVVSEPYDVAAGARGMARLLDLRHPPTAVLCYSDEIAVSALSELHRRGLRMPQDVSLIGIDGHPLAGLFGITSADQDVAGQGRIAASMALRLMEGRPLAQSQMRVGWHLVDRGSTCAPGGGAPPDP